MDQNKWAHKMHRARIGREGTIYLIEIIIQILLKDKTNPDEGCELISWQSVTKKNNILYTFFRRVTFCISETKYNESLCGQIWSYRQKIQQKLKKDSLRKVNLKYFKIKKQNFKNKFFQKSDFF